MLSYANDRYLIESESNSLDNLIKDLTRKIETDDTNSFITFLSDSSIFKFGRPPRTLEGMAIAIKDNISTTQFDTTCASEMLRGYRPSYDATAVRRLRDAGAIIIGKTNMDEFAMGCASRNSAFGAVSHPVFDDHSPGGSSGGSAAAVAGGMCHAALGSDSGGSVRQPASLCGVCGFRPTYGRLSRYGLIAFASSLDQIGIIAPDMDTIQRVFDVIKGHDENDLTSLFKSINFQSFNMCDLRIGYIPVDNQICSPVIAMAYENAINNIMKNNDCSQIHDNINTYALPAYHIISAAEASSNLARYDGIRFGGSSSPYDSEFYELIRTRRFGDEVKRRIMLGTYALSQGYASRYFHKAQAVRRMISDIYIKVFREHDIIISPTVPIETIKNCDSNNNVNIYNSDYYTAGPSLAGLPAVTIPIDSGRGFAGLQIIGTRMSDEVLLETAKNILEIVSA
ncbi:MAG: amidase family protein [Candidatus Kapaibacterium sp.]